MPISPSIAKNFLVTHISKIIIVAASIVFVLVALFIANYFNIIYLNSIFPSLPKNVTTNTKSDFDTFIASTINSPYVPKTYTVSRLIPSNQELSKGISFYTIDWSVDTPTKMFFSLLLEYDTKNVLSDRQVIIHIPQVMTNISPNVASAVIKTYLHVNNLSPFLCQSYEPNTINTICESFWSTGNAKIGINITSPEPGIKNTKITYCERRQNNPAYSWKSCDLIFKDTGVGAK